MKKSFRIQVTMHVLLAFSDYSRCFCDQNVDICFLQVNFDRKLRKMACPQTQNACTSTVLIFLISYPAIWSTIGFILFSLKKTFFKRLCSFPNRKIWLQLLSSCSCLRCCNWCSCRYQGGGGGGRLDGVAAAASGGGHPVFLRLLIVITSPYRDRD